MGKHCDTVSLAFDKQRTRHLLARIAFWATCCSAVSILIGIAPSQVLLGIGIVSFLLSGSRIRWPRPWLPMVLFLLGTLISLAVSVDPHAGLPQVRKLYVYLTLFLVYSVVRRLTTARNLLLTWCALGGVVSLLGIAQFAQKWQQAHALHRDFYEYYLSARITGFMSHWMTFSGEQMLVLLILVAFLLFGRMEKRWWLIASIGVACVLAIALVLSDTRSVWIAICLALVYLAWSRKKVLALAIPVLVMVALLASPQPIRDRAISIVRPHGQMDSNDFRRIVWLTGVRIIESHPLLGLGPEEVHAQFYQWLPPEIPRPLPPGYYGHLHSIYVHYAAERGIPTTLMLLWMLGMIIYHCATALRRLGPGRSDARFLLQAGIACIIGILIEGFFELNLGDSEVLTMFLVLTACVYVAVDESRRLETAGSNIAA